MSPTPRELEVLAAWAACGGIRQASLRLGIAEGTIRGHLVAVRERLGARSSAQAFVIAVQKGLIDPAQLSVAA